MKELWPTRACLWLCRRIGDLVATWPRTTILICILITALPSSKFFLDKEVSVIDGWSKENARSRYEFKVFQEFLNADGLGITLIVILRAKDNQSMIRMEHMTEALEILELVSAHFPMYNADLGRNQSFKEFCKEFCQANEPVKMFYNGLRVLEENVTGEFRHRINFSYPTSEIFGVKFSLLPNFFGVELKENGELKSATVIALAFRAGKHRSWTTEMVKKWELNIENYFSHYESELVEVNVVSMSIVENAMLEAAITLRPFLVIGFTIMCIFCTTTTLTSSVLMYHHKATINKVILSVAACVVPFMACGTAIGTMLIIGVRFAPILHITTFLVLAVSVDDSFLMIHAWNRLAKGNNEKTHDRAKIMSQVLVETGPAIVISSCTNAFAFAIGAVSSPPDIRIFCIGNACAILVDMVYQFTLYTAMMTLFADFPKNSGDKEEHPKVKERAQRLLRRYTDLVADFSFSVIIVLLWALFVAGAIVGLTYSTVDLSAHKVFKRDSKLLKIDRLRNEYMTPSYTFATVVVSNPGNFSDTENVQGLVDMKNAFETLPHAIGPESTKFVLSEYLNYKEAIEEEMGEDPSIASLDEFLSWPEYSYYNGFIKRGNTSRSDDVSQFMFITAYRGQDLVQWHERGRMLNSWRSQVDRFKQYNASVFSEDGFLVDLLEALPTMTWQTGLATFICVIIICAMFINHPATILFVSISILAICTGVFGYMSLFGVTLDPIVMSISIMCVGFSVDIPAHVSFHFHASRTHVIKRSTCSTLASNGGEVPGPGKVDESYFKSRLQHTLRSVGFPVIQAGLSTILCALPLAFLPLYMSQVFSVAMTMCISFSMTHGLLILPAMFCLYDRALVAVRTWISADRRKIRCVPA